MIQAGQGGGEEEQRDDEIFRRLRLLSAEDEKGETGDEGGEDQPLHRRRVFQAVQQLVLAPAAAELARGEAAFD